MFQTVHYAIHSNKIPAGFEGYRMIHLSDLHGAEYGSGNDILVEKIHEFRPHSIMMTGDMADHTEGSVERLTALCRKLCSHYPVYYVAGNHEQCLKKPVLEGLTSELKHMGVSVLENQWCTISKGGDFVRLYGLVMPMIYYKDPLGEYKRGIEFRKEDTERFLGTTESSCYKILLSHNPLYYPAYRDWGADLTLSGHVHGGIIRIPGLGGLLSPDVTLFPKYDGGLFEEQGRHLIVSRGLGNHFLVRVMNPPELVAVSLFNQKQGN